MYKKLGLWVLVLMILSGCSDGFRSYFKRSANNKLFDTKGFKGDKRMPLYNQKYISKAKRNIVYDDIEDDDEEDVEYKVPSRVYRQMYLERLAQERDDRVRFNRHRASLRDYDYVDEYPSLQDASRKVNAAPAPDHKALQKEIKEIKSLLKQTQEELTKYKCNPPAGVGKQVNYKPIVSTPDTNYLGENKASVNRGAETSLQKKFIKPQFDI